MATITCKYCKKEILIDDFQLIASRVELSRRKINITCPLCNKSYILDDDISIKHEKRDFYPITQDSVPAWVIPILGIFNSVVYFFCILLIIDLEFNLLKKFKVIIGLLIAFVVFSVYWAIGKKVNKREESIIILMICTIPFVPLSIYFSYFLIGFENFGNFIVSFFISLTVFGAVQYILIQLIHIFTRNRQH